MKELQPITLPGLDTARPLLIAGPCSAETEEQVLSTAHALARRGVQIFRAGIWKPRTKPGGFEGVGPEGIAWLRRVKEEVGMFTATEVATHTHVEEALKGGIDLLWIGARTAANPFAMQEIADSLKGVDIPVLVKNPVSPDLELWIGALERIYNAGIRRLGAVHRGFTWVDKSIYRNHPFWTIPIELQRRIPNMPILCDPSHIGGKRELIAPLSQQAMDLGFDGLLIEAHCNPDAAWSDKAQQVAPETLAFIISNLILRDMNTTTDTALLYERFKAGLPGLIFLPCELIDKNGITLKKYMLQYAAEWNLGADYIDYIENANTFCCTLVDRIVAGYPRATAGEICEKLGYKDNLLDCGEPFHFFVIEAPDGVEAELPLREAGLDVVFVKNQAPYRTRKVRFLNGAHTATIPAAYLAGFDFVDEVVADPFFGKYMRTLLFEEVYPTVDLPDDEKTAFASAIVERFANPFAMHRLLSIALNSVSKWKVRVLPSLLDYLKIKGQLPKVLSFSLAALIAFYRNEGGTGLGRVNAYPVADSDGIAAFFEDQWKSNDIPAIVKNVLARTDFWDMDLNTVPGLTDNVITNLKNIQADGVRLAAGALF